jgi:hypothetical protein
MIFSMTEAEGRGHRRPPEGTFNCTRAASAGREQQAIGS